MDSGASIVRADEGGNLLDYVAISEERLLRKKHPYTFPLHSVDYCMKYFGIKNIEDIDLLVCDWIRKKQWEFSGKTFNISEFDYLKNIFLFPRNRIRIISHHLAHAASTYYTSGFKKSAILIVDGNGSDLETTSYFEGKNFKINFIKNYKFFGLGALYNIVSTRILAMGTGGEGKTMGLAPYGKSYSKSGIKFPYFSKGIINDFSNFMQRMPYSDVLNQINSSYRVDPINVNYKKVKYKNDVLKPYFAGTAYNLQNTLEKVIVKISKDLYNITKNENLCIAGGVGLNSVANKKILDKTKFKNIFIFPACSDSGIPFGLAIWGYYNLKELKIKKHKKLVFKNAYLGNKYSNKEIKSVLDRYQINYKKSNLNKVAQLISEKKIVGWFQGRSEYGPRSLGNRSILADSRSNNMKDILNKRVKHREFYRPFAPSILEEDCKKYFELDSPSPYMLLIAKVKKKTIPSVTHVDNTARVQTVNKYTNEKFYNLIQEFKKLTDIPCVLNTSFNDAGDPIVETPEDALYTLMKCDMDYLYIGNFLIERKKIYNEKKMKKIYLDILKNVEETKKIIINKYFKNYSDKEKEKFISHHNKKSLTDLLYTAKKGLEKKLKIWQENKNKIIIIGDKKEIEFLNIKFNISKKLKCSSKIYIENNNDDIFIIYKDIEKKLKKQNFDEILIASFQYNFYLEDLCIKNNLNYYKIYNSTDRSLENIFKKKFIEKFEKGKL
tara:strand:- start:12477 stop:14642 length:2166 start_codon:yes stop_codon:yes gene_type:complete